MSGQPDPWAPATRTSNEPGLDALGPLVIQTHIPRVCEFHHCGASCHFVQAPLEAPGVGRWTHCDPALNYSAATGRGHVPLPMRPELASSAKYEVQTGKGAGRYSDTRTFTKFMQAWAYYTGLNVCAPYKKRLTRNGVTLLRQIGDSHTELLEV